MFVVLDQPLVADNLPVVGPQQGLALPRRARREANQVVVVDVHPLGRLRTVAEDRMLRLDPIFPHRSSRWSHLQIYAINCQFSISFYRIIAQQLGV